MLATFGISTSKEWTEPGKKGTPVMLLVGHSRGKLEICGKHYLPFGLFPLYRPYLLMPLFPSTGMLDPDCSLAPENLLKT